MIRFVMIALLAVCTVAPAASGRAAGELKAALEGEHRSAENRARDAFRHPAETLSFFGLRSDMTVIEIFPGGGWYTEVLAPTLRAGGGRLIAAHYGEESSVEYRAKSHQRFVEKLTAEPAVYDQVEVIAYDPPDRTSLGADGSADMVLTFRNLHGMVNAGTAASFFESAFAVLRPGGTLGVVQHRAPAGADPAESAKMGYVPEAHVIGLAEDAGFVLVGQSEVNANPRDTRDYEGGVWTLPPSLRGDEENREKHSAIGESDRMTLRFLKPL